MKAILLAAGRGSRLGEYTRDRPKCLLPVGGVSLLDRLVASFLRMNIDDIVVVRGYRGDRVEVPGARHYSDPAHCHNMVYSLFCAEPELDGEVIIAFTDILVEERVLNALLTAPPVDVAVVCDTEWRSYYEQRYSDPYGAAESLVCRDDGRILEIGNRSPSPDRVQGQAIGLIRLSSEGTKILRDVYAKAKEEYSGKVWRRGLLFENADISDLLQEIIEFGADVYAVPIAKGWLEIDSCEDYEQVLAWYDAHTIDRFCRLDSVSPES